jgi:hypothetical protein
MASNTLQYAFVAGDCRSLVQLWLAALQYKPFTLFCHEVCVLQVL